MLAHILGRLPCPKKIPRKIWNSMLAQFGYRMKIRKAENYCRIIHCATKICNCRLSIVDCRSVRHIAQGVLAHILGRLPCPKKTPRKIWNSVLAHLVYQNRMKIRRAEIVAESSAALRKFAKSGTNLQIASLFVYIITAKLLQKHQLHYVTRLD